MEKIKFPYRSDGHLALLHVIHESGAWEKQGLDEVEREPELVEALYDDLAPLLEAKLYPTLPAIRNVFELALHDHPECAEINPLSLWNLHYLRTLEG